MQVKAPFLQDPDVKTLLAAMGEAECYFVGGCVRNLLLDERVTDLDISTVLRPEDVTQRAEAAGLRAIPTGLDHGTVTVIAGDTPFEVTTFRKDVETDGRRAVIAFANTIFEDACRRDFTMNALYLDGGGVLHDPVEGLKDLQDRHFRFIGDAEIRIKEDALRILRFFRFHASYGRGSLNQVGLDACALHVELLDDLSRERVGSEMLRLLFAPGAVDALDHMQKIGALERVLPGSNVDFFERGIRINPNGDDDAVFRLALLDPDDPGSALRLPRVDLKRFDRIKSASSSDESDAVLGYRIGARDGMASAALRYAKADKQPHANWDSAVRDGSTRTCPIKATDLSNWYQGADLGAALKRAEDIWLNGGFEPTKAELLSAVRPDA